jgi:hypothetical protein
MFYCVYVDNIEEESDLDLDEALDLVEDILTECPDKLIRIEPMTDEEEEEEEGE